MSLAYAAVVVLVVFGLALWAARPPRRTVASMRPGRVVLRPASGRFGPDRA